MYTVTCLLSSLNSVSKISVILLISPFSIFKTVYLRSLFIKISSSQKLMFSLTILLIFKNFSEFLTSRKLTKNLPPLICLFLLDCCSRESFWKRVVWTFLCPSLSNSDSKQDVAFGVVMRSSKVCFVSEKFWQVDHCSIHVPKNKKNPGLLLLQTTAFRSILEVLYCALASHIIVLNMLNEISGIRFLWKVTFYSRCYRWVQG